MKIQSGLFFALLFKSFIFTAQCTFTTGITNSGTPVGCGSRTLSVNNAGNVWTQKSNFSGTGRISAVGFSIGSKGYIGTGDDGSTYKNDFWEYDPSTNAWTQKANFTGGARYGATGFAIGSKGYLGTGYDGSTFKNDFWEYDPSTNVWTQKTNFGGSARLCAAAFVINGKGYVGTGGANGIFNDFWEYDPSSNTWTQKSGFSGGQRYNAVGFSIGTKGYMGSGQSGPSTCYNDFWEYDPTTNYWTNIASLGTAPFTKAVAFTLSNKGYVATGFDPATGQVSNKIWKYEPVADTWTQMNTMGTNNERSSAVGFAIGAYGYVGTGYNNGYLSTFWQYESEPTYTWSTGALTQAITTSVSGTYSVLVMSAAGCSASATQTLSLAANPLLIVNGPLNVCTGSSASFTASGASSYTWSSNAGSGNSTTVSVSPSASTVYTVSGTTGTCTVNYTVPLNLIPPPLGTISVSGTTVGCGSRTLTVNPIGNSWTQKASFPGTVRQSAVAFSINNKGYMGTGFDNNGNRKDFWEYDPLTNAWTQKADFGGTARNYAVGFSIGNKGYLGTGNDGSFKSDFWEYDPITNNWTQKASFIGAARDRAAGFSVNNKGYIGTGNSGYPHLDFFEYNPSTNTWTQKGNFGGGQVYHAIGMSIGTKGYIGTGVSNSTVSIFWEYEPTTDVWTQKSDMGNVVVFGATAFSINNRGYVAGGYESPNTISNKLWEFNPSTNSWMQLQDLGTNGRALAASFSIGSKGYVGCGLNGSNFGTLFEYEPPTSYLWSTSAATNSIVTSVAGNYSVFLTTAAGCTATGTQSMAITPNPTLSVIGGSLACYGMSNTLTVSGANTYTWSANAGGGNTSSVVVSPLSNTSYTVSGTTGSCSVSYPLTLVVNPVPSAAIAVSGPTLNCGTLTLSTNTGGNTWIQKSSMSTGRQNGVAFSIGNKGYMGLGSNYSLYPTSLNDMWEYDPLTDAWTQKANFIGGTRDCAVGFSIGNKGYVGGGNSYTVGNSFWEFDPITNTWTQKANISSEMRYNATGFSLNGKGYIGTGFDPVSGYMLNDFWEYTPSTNTWVQKANVPGLARYSAASFTIGSKGYLGTGWNPNNHDMIDFYEYDPATDTWTQKANYGGGGGKQIVAMGISSRGYFGTGNISSVMSNDMWEYNPTNNTWNQMASLPGSIRSGASGFVIGNKGYIGTGIGSLAGTNALADLYEYSPRPSIQWSNNSMMPQTTVSVSGTYSVLVTNSTGCYATSAVNVSLSPNPPISVTASNVSCNGVSNLLVASGANTYTWSANAGNVNTASVTVVPTSNTVYTVSGTTGSCTVNYPVTIYVVSTPVASISVSGPTLACGTLTLNASGGNAWIQRANVSVSRADGVSFSIGNKGYMGTGYLYPSYYSDFWEYDPLTDAWTQKANFVGGLRGNATGFSIGSKGYVGTGYDPVTGNDQKDFWEFDPVVNVWTRKADLPGSVRTAAGGFSIGTKGYIGTGYHSVYNTSGMLNDFWEYDPATDIWTQKANYGGSGRYLSTSFATAGKGYIGLGSPSYNSFNNYLNDFWAYDPTTNTWTQKANYPAGQAQGVVAFGMNGKAYAGMGMVQNVGYTNTFYEYEPLSDIWTQKANFGGAPRQSGFGFAIGNRAYMGSGISNQSYPYYMVDVWEYMPSYSQVWSTGATLPAITVSLSGMYSVTITNASGCNALAAQSVSLSPNPTLMVSGGSTVCSGSSNTFIANGANTYTWSANAGAGNSPTLVISPTVSSTYTVSGTTGSCSVAYPLAITVNTLPIVSAVVSSPTVCEGSTITLVGAGASTYTWTGGVTNNVAYTPTITNSYTVTGTNPQGCVGLAVASVTVNPRPLVSVNSGTSCAGDSFTLIPSGAISYSYSSGPVVSPTITSTYSVVGINIFGCTNLSPALTTLTVHPLPQIIAPGGGICPGQSFTINPTGAASYTFSSTQIVSPSATSAYSVSGTSSMGCVSASPAIVNVTVNPNPFISVSNGTLCEGQSYTLNPSGAYSYTFSNGSAIVSPTVNSSYSISGTSAAGCIASNTAVVTLTVHPNPTVSVGSGSICAGDSFTLVPTGAINYSYSGGSAIVSPSSSAVYSITGFNTYGCQAIVPAIASITVNALPIVTANSGAICPGGSFTIIPFGALTYTFSNGPIVSPSSLTSYSVTGTNSLGCVSSSPAIVNVTVNPTPLISVSNSAICAGDSYTLNPTGAATYTFSSGPVVTPALNTSYSITGTSAAGCIASNTAVATITVNSRPVISVNSGSICAGEIFTIVPSGAISYTVINNNFTVSPVPLGPVSTSSYMVIGTNSLGCISANSATSAVTVHALPIITVNNGTVCAGDTFTMNPSGANSYTFSNGSSTVTPLTTGIYSVSGTNSMGCVSSVPAIASITVYSLPQIVVNSDSVCLGDVFVMNPTGAISYTFSNGSSTVIPIVSSAYSITGTSTEGCVSTIPVVSHVTVNALPVITVNSGTVCLGEVFTITPAGAATYSYSSGPNVSPLVNSSYTVTGTSAQGCTALSPAISNVTVMASPIVSVNSGTICSGQSFTIVPAGAISYTISGGSYIVSPLVTVSYSVLGSNANGCVSATALSSVEVHDLPNVNISSTSPTMCLGESVTLVASGANSYTWSEGSLNDSLYLSPLVTTTYSVTGLDGNGCVNVSNFNQVVDACTGIKNNIGNSRNIALFPNPNTGNFYIEVFEESEAVILNSIGQPVLKIALQTGRTPIEMLHEAKGIYFVNITSRGEKQVFKVIKQ